MGMKIVPKLWKSVAPLILGALPICYSALAADEVNVKFSGRDRILMPPTNDLEKEWDKTGRLGGGRQQPSDPGATFIPSTGGNAVLKNPVLRKWLSDRQNWMSPKVESDTFGTGQEEKALGVRDYSGILRNNSSLDFNVETENTKSTSKTQKKDSSTTPAWEPLSNKNSSQSSKSDRDGYSTDKTDSANKSFSFSPLPLSSPLPDLNKSTDGRTAFGNRNGTSTYQSPFLAVPDSSSLPSMTDPGSVMKMDKARLADLHRKEEFQRLLQPRSAGPDILAGVNDPVNLWQDNSRTEMNPVTGSSMDELSGRSKGDIFGFNQFGSPSLHNSRPGFFESLSAKSLGQSSLSPALAPIAAPEFRPNPGVLEMPVRRKF